MFFNLIEVEVNVKLANLESGKKEEIEEKVEIQRNRFFLIFFIMKLSLNDLLNLKTRIQGQFLKFKRSFENIFMVRKILKTKKNRFL